MIIKFVLVLMSVGLAFITIFTTLFSFLIGDRYYLLLNCNLPFLPPENLAFYLINMVHQLYTLITAFLYVNQFLHFVYSCLTCVVMHLEAIKVLIGNMEEGIRVKDFHKWLKLVATEIQDVKM